MLGTVFFVLFILFTVAGQIVESGLVLTIRQHYPDYYERVGEPPIVFVGPLKIGASLSFALYILLNEFRQDEVPGQVLDSLVVTRNLYYASLVCLLAALAASLIPTPFG